MPKIDTYTIGLNLESKNVFKALSGLDNKLRTIQEKADKGITLKGGVSGVSGVSGVGEKSNAPNRKGSRIAEASTLGAIAGKGFLAAGLSTAVITSAIGDVADLETAIVGVGKTTGITGDELKSLKKDILGLGKSTAVPSRRLFEIAETAGTLGVKGSENILKFTDTVAKLDLASSDFKGSEAASTLQTILTLTKEGTEDVDKLASSLVVLGNNYNTTEGQAAKLAQEIAIGLQGKGAKSSEIISLAGVLAELKAAPEAARSAFSRVSFEIDSALNQGEKSLNQFTSLLGVNAKDFVAAYEKGIVPAIELMTQGLAEQEALGVNTSLVLDELGFKNQGDIKLIKSLITQNERLKQVKMEVNQEYSNATALITEAETANDTYQSSVTRLKNSFLSLKDTLLSALLPALTKISDSLANTLGWYERLIKIQTSKSQLRQLGSAETLLNQEKELRSQIGQTSSPEEQQRLAREVRDIFKQRNKIESSARPDLIPVRSAPSYDEIISQSTQINIQNANFENTGGNVNELASDIKTGVNTNVPLPNGTGF